MPVAMELSRIIISEINDQQVIYLKEIDGPRTFPILIGIFEATSIDRRVKGFEAPRPLTHDLLVGAERKRLEKDRENISKQIKSIDGKLSNKGFVDKAPPEVVQQQRDKLGELREQMVSVEAAMKKLG